MSKLRLPRWLAMCALLPLLGIVAGLGLAFTVDTPAHAAGTDGARCNITVTSAGSGTMNYKFRCTWDPAFGSVLTSYNLGFTNGAGSFALAGSRFPTTGEPLTPFSGIVASGTYPPGFGEWVTSSPISAPSGILTAPHTGTSGSTLYMSNTASASGRVTHGFSLTPTFVEDASSLSFPEAFDGASLGLEGPPTVTCGRTSFSPNPTDSTITINASIIAPTAGAGGATPSGISSSAGTSGTFTAGTPGPGEAARWTWSGVADGWPTATVNFVVTWSTPSGNPGWWRTDHFVTSATSTCTAGFLYADPANPTKTTIPGPGDGVRPVEPDYGCPDTSFTSFSWVPTMLICLFGPTSYPFDLARWEAEHSDGGWMVPIVSVGTFFASMNGTLVDSGCSGGSPIDLPIGPDRTTSVNFTATCDDERLDTVRQVVFNLSTLGFVVGLVTMAYRLVRAAQ